MNSTISTIQFNLNPWHLGMSFEVHAYVKEIIHESKLQSQYIFLGNLNQDLIPGNRPKSRFRQDSKNYKRIKFLNSLLYKNEFRDLVSQSRELSCELFNALINLDFFEILDFVHQKEGIDASRAMKAVELALIDKEKIWNVDSLHKNPNSIYLLKAYIRTFLSVREILKNSQHNYVNLFNTRFLDEGAARDAALDLNSKIIEFEQVNSRSDSFGLFLESVHSSKERAALVRNLKIKETKKAISSSIPSGRIWIEMRKKGVLQSFTKRQKKGKLPKLPDNKKIITCFLSSFDELILAGYVNTNSQFTQDNSLEAICSVLAREQDWHLVIRSHPNMLTRPKIEQRYWRKKLEHLDAQIIQPDDEVDSYALIEKSTLVLTFGSTMGVEALAMGKASLLLGESLYSGLNLSWKLTSPKELKRFLDQPPGITNEQIDELNLYCEFQLFGGFRFRYLSVLPQDKFELNPSLYYKGKLYFRNRSLIRSIREALKNSLANPLREKGD